jgi:uncharacterized protein (DUF2235 family)
MTGAKKKDVKLYIKGDSVFFFGFSNRGISIKRALVVTFRCLKDMFVILHVEIWQQY